jgi:glucose/arabinose dehydrogenase
VQPFATGLTHPRWLYVLPNGDVLVAETNRPPTEDPQDNPVRNAFMKHAFEEAGADVESPNRITLLRDHRWRRGIAETKVAFMTTCTRRSAWRWWASVSTWRMRIRWCGCLTRKGETHIDAKPTKLADLPGAPRNHHWTKSLVANADGSRLLRRRGAPTAMLPTTAWRSKANRAAILEIDAATGASRVYASGLRNPVGLAWAPGTRTLYAVVNERDELGNDLVPDYLTSVKPGAFYGWPWSYYGAHVDTRVKPARPDMVAKAIAPDYALGPHVAALGSGVRFRQAVAGCVAQRGVHRVARVVESGSAVGLQGGVRAVRQREACGGGGRCAHRFLDADGKAHGRPVGVAMAKDGALLVADDVGNTVWRVFSR